MDGCRDSRVNCFTASTIGVGRLVNDGDSEFFILSSMVLNGACVSAFVVSDGGAGASGVDS